MGGDALAVASAALEGLGDGPRDHRQAEENRTPRRVVGWALRPLGQGWGSGAWYSGCSQQTRIRASSAARSLFRVTSRDSYSLSGVVGTASERA